jgi:hypothetical protein
VLKERGIGKERIGLTNLKKRSALEILRWTIEVIRNSDFGLSQGGLVKSSKEEAGCHAAKQVIFVKCCDDKAVAAPFGCPSQTGSLFVSTGVF